MIFTGDEHLGLVTSSISFVILEGVVFLVMISLATVEEWIIWMSKIVVELTDKTRDTLIKHCRQSSFCGIPFKIHVNTIINIL